MKGNEILALFRQFEEAACRMLECKRFAGIIRLF